MKGVPEFSITRYLDPSGCLLETTCQNWPAVSPIGMSDQIDIRSLPGGQVITWRSKLLVTGFTLCFLSPL